MFQVLRLMVVLFFCCGSAASAQVKAVFERVEYDFGKIKEENGTVSFDFKFQNKSNAPIQVTNVSTSCGCTTPEWNTAPVSPGEFGVVKALYNPHNRPNAFAKTLEVTFSNGEKADLLIKGIVMPKIKTAKDEFYDRQGAVSVKTRYFNLGTVFNQGISLYEYELYNAADYPVKITSVKAPGHVQVKIEPQKILPGTIAKLTVKYDAAAKNDFGNFTEHLDVTTDDKELPVKRFFLISNIVEFFPTMTEAELAKAPKISFEFQEYDYGKIKESSSPEARFKITNTGISPLIIRKILPSCGCMSTSIDKKTIEPGGVAYLTVKFDAKGKEGRQLKTVTVYANDALAAVSVLKLKAVVEK